ncbi:hypothetical protein [Streptomyces avicenniae]|uniref:hypothetical protein n=1 Tax=Streptomyces avicenniae TaxID=500153 RepID=UPI00167D7663|nr:hypothetical protein [Streptomyces avicenniae]
MSPHSGCPPPPHHLPPFDRADAPAVLRRYAARTHRLLTHPHAAPGRPGSPLERACHARDICLAFHTRLGITLGLPAAPLPIAPPPPVPYRDENPRTVAHELRAAAEALADRLALLSPADWARHDPRPAAAPFTVETLTDQLLRTLAHLLTEVALPA